MQRKNISVVRVVQQYSIVGNSVSQYNINDRQLLRDPMSPISNIAEIEDMKLECEVLLVKSSSIQYYK